MSADLPWFPFHVERFTGSRAVRRMSSEHVGIYVLLLCEEWMRGPLPSNADDLEMLTPSDIADVRSVLRKCFRKTADGWVNDTLEEIRAEQQKKAEKHRRAGLAGAKARWDKGKNGNRIATALRPQCDTNSKRREENRIEETREKRELRARTGYEKAVGDYLGEYADAVDAVPDYALRSIKGLYLPNGTQERVWGVLPEAERPRVLATALLRWSGENHTSMNQRLFVRILETVISEGNVPDADDGFWGKEVSP